MKGTKKNGEQNFTLTWHKDIRPKGRTLCWDISDPNDKADIVLYPCHGAKGNQYWKYNSVLIQIITQKHIESICFHFRRNNGLFMVEILDV